jgi:HEAT repeat protein
LGALSAAEEYSAPSDFASLVEAARLDPLPEARAAAARAIGVIGGPEAVRALRDLWTNGDSQLRNSIALGWASPRSYAAGGQAELLWAAQNDTGDGAIAAALQIIRWNPEQTEHGHPEAVAPEDRNIALGVLTRAIKLGTRESRMATMSSAPTTPEILEAVRAAKDDTDPGIQISAWTRLHSDGTADEKKTALAKLYDVAKSDSPDAGRAQESLAWFGDIRVEPLLAKQLVSPIGGARALGARGFVALGKRAKAASLLADKEIDVRVQAACAILIKKK